MRKSHILCCLLCMILCATVLTGRVAAADEGTISYTYADKVLTISGTGDMPHYTYDSDYETTASWWSELRTAEKIVVKDGITSIGRFAFHNCPNVKEVVIGNDVETIGAGAFNDSLSLEKVTLGSGVKNIECRMPWLEEIHISDLSAFCGISGKLLANAGSSNPKLYLNGELVTDLVVPEDVTELGNIFYNYLYLNSVTIHDGVTSIADDAFSYCYCLKKVTFLGDAEDTEIVIGDNTFKSCQSLSDVILSERIKELSDNMFAGCAFTEIEIPESVEIIGNNVFYRCEELTSIQIPSSIKGIYNSVFADCTGLTKVEIPDTVTTLGNGVFSGCSNLKEVRFPAGLDYFGARMLSGCISLSNVTIPLSVKGIGAGALQDCVAIKSVMLPDAVTEIGADAFSGCTALTAVTIPNGVTKLSDGVFSGCTALSEISLPTELTTLGARVFSGCTALTAMTLPDTVTEIGESAFKNCTGLTEFSLPDGVLTLSDSIFAGCVNLDNVTLSSVLTGIGSNALSGSGITEITIPAAVHSIGSKAFKDCNELTKVTFLGSSPTIANDAFSGIDTVCWYTPDDSWTAEILTFDFGGNLIWEYEGKTTDSLCGEFVNWELTNDGVLKITGFGAMYDYSVDELQYAPWYEMRASITDIQIDDGVTHIGDAAFYQCTAAKSVTMPDSVISIGAHAFESCKASAFNLSANLIEIGEYAFKSTVYWYVVLPESITTIGKGAFSNSEVLTISLPDGLEEIPNTMFYNCYYLNEVTFPSRLKTIGNSAFENCYGLSSIVLPEGLTSIGAYAFKACGANDLYGSYYTAWRFKSVSLPSTLQTIGAGAFTYCQSLTTINLPDGVKEIGAYTFGYCYDLTSITIPENIILIATDAFYQCKSLKNIIFDWNAPEIGSNAFGKVTATCYYPSNNSEWTSSMLQNYGGTLTWVSQEMEAPGTGENEGEGEDDSGETGDDNGESGTGGNSGTGDGGGSEGGNSGEGDGSGEGGTTPGDTCENGHTEVTDAAVAPTCTTTGLTLGKHCSVCGVVTVAQEVVDALGHTEADPVEENRVEATATKDGSYDIVVYCSVCGAEIGRETIILPATFVVKNHTGGNGEEICSFSADGKTMTVRHERACVVLIEHADGTYTRLTATKNPDDGYDFGLSDMKTRENIVIAVKGDLNGDGAIKLNEVIQVKKAQLGNSTFSALEFEISDLNDDGIIKLNEVIQIKKAQLGNGNLNW